MDSYNTGMSLGQIIRNRREENKLTLDEVAAIVSFSKPYLSTVETGRTKNPPSDNCIKKLEEVLGFERGLLLYMAHYERMTADIKASFELLENQNKLLRRAIMRIIEKKGDIENFEEILAGINLDADKNRPPFSPGMHIPVFNKSTSPYPAQFDDMGLPAGTAYEYIRFPDIHDPDAFAITVVGDSMKDKYKQGDIIIFSPQADVHSGDDCFVRFSGSHENSFNRVFFENDHQARLQPINQKYPPLIVDRNSIKGMYRAIVTLKIIHDVNSTK